MKKLLVATLAAAALGAGATVIAAVDPLGSAGAQTTPPAPAPATPERPVASVLSGLVADGTLTQQQADTVEARLAQFRKDHRPIADAAKEAVSVAASTIGIDVKDLRTQLRSGMSVAAVAAAHNVDEKTVVDAVVTDISGKIDQAAANGTITSERATTMKAKLPERVTKLVEAVHGQHH